VQRKAGRCGKGARTTVRYLLSRESIRDFSGPPRSDQVRRDEWARANRREEATYLTGSPPGGFCGSLQCWLHMKNQMC
jgi:hypothetical protein